MHEMMNQAITGYSDSEAETPELDPADTSIPQDESLYLLSIPGMKEAIIKGMQTPWEQCDEDLAW